VRRENTNGGDAEGGPPRGSSPTEADVAEVQAALASASLNVARQAREARQAARIARQARQQEDLHGVEDAMLAAALSISIAEEEEQHHLDAVVAMSQDSHRAYGFSFDGMSDLLQMMVEAGEAHSAGHLARGFDQEVGPFSFPAEDEESLLKKAQRESLLEAWRASLPLSFHDTSRSGCQEAVECPLCLADFKQGDAVMHLDCLHFFHVECISPWIATKSSCPLCKVDFLESFSECG